jgi:hypothetical protein
MEVLKGKKDPSGIELNVGLLQGTEFIFRVAEYVSTLK